VWKRGDGRGSGWNTLALCVGYNFILSFYRFSFIVATVAPPLVPSGCGYGTLPISELLLVRVNKRNQSDLTSGRAQAGNGLYPMLAVV